MRGEPRKAAEGALAPRPVDGERWGAGLPPSALQRTVGVLALGLVAAIAALQPRALLGLTVDAFTALFLVAGVWRGLVLLLARRAPPAPAAPEADLPSYTVIAAVFREEEILPQLVRNLAALDYPRDRLQVILALETGDDPTLAAAAALPLPPGFEVLVVPPGSPRTKPRACNHALARARGELVVIYDAEDRPEPDQLRAAAAAFTAGPERLACVQSPLRIVNSGGFLRAQFANEYAAQFELLQPAMVRLGLPFPLGGTSNHFRRSALEAIGGWDPWNVTEDADLGFRLARGGWRTGVIGSATWEPAPDELHDWLPQRTRWLKGYMQTCLVQTRRGLPEPRVSAALALTLGVTLASAAVHFWAAAWLATYALFSLMGGPGPSLSALQSAALGVGASTAIVSGLVGAARAGLPVRLRDALLAPAYWPLLTIAFLHALVRLFLEPHHWDKTPHKPWLFPPR